MPSPTNVQKVAIESDLNVTPMLDVMLVLLVIFMAATAAAMDLRPRAGR